MKFRFVEDGPKEEVCKIAKNGNLRTSDMEAGIHFKFNPDKDGTVLLGIGDWAAEMKENSEKVSSQWLSATDLREAADLFNFLADELDKVK